MVVLVCQLDYPVADPVVDSAAVLVDLRTHELDPLVDEDEVLQYQQATALRDLVSSHLDLALALVLVQNGVDQLGCPLLVCGVLA